MGKVGYSHDFGTILAGKENRMLHMLELLFGQAGQMGELVWPIAFMQSAGVPGASDELDALTEKIAKERIKVFILISHLMSIVYQLTKLKNRDTASPDIFSHLLADFEADKPVAYFNRNILYADASIIFVGAT